MVTYLEAIEQKEGIRVIQPGDKKPSLGDFKDLGNEEKTYSRPVILKI